jgi:hypothetical protein
MWTVTVGTVDLLEKYPFRSLRRDGADEKRPKSCDVGRHSGCQRREELHHLLHQQQRFRLPLLVWVVS